VIGLDDLPDAVVVLDADRRIAAANDAAVALAGRALVGEPVSVLAPAGRDGRPLLCDDWHPSARLPAVRRIPEQEVTITTARGGETVFVTGRYRRDPGGRLAGAVLVLRPAGRRRHLAAEGVEVISTVSHELRSPLTSVKGYTSLLLNRWERLRDDQKRLMLEQVHQDADRVTRLITELLDFSRLETGRLVLRRQRVDLAELARRVVEKVRLAEPRLDCALRFPPGLPHVWADPDKIEQVLTNLVENAAKYGSPEGMEIVATLDDGTVAVAVHDRGAGIPPRVLPHVFDKFFRGPDTKPSGTGLGLWISRGLIEAHGGRMEATSVPGQGSTFRFTLPLEAMEDQT
jgi:signal transduction histidine kinase